MPITLTGMDTPDLRRHRPGTHLILTLVLLAVCAVGGPGTASAQTTDILAVSLSDMIDAARAEQGHTPLGWDPSLAEIARGWSETMAAEGRLSHNPGASAAHQGDWTTFAENVGQALIPGADPATVVARLHDAFMQSSGHRANILDPAHRSIGVGVVVEAGGRVWVTVDFADSIPPEAAPTPTPRAHFQRPLP